jgi:hypothetical protein
MIHTNSISTPMNQNEINVKLYKCSGTWHEAGCLNLTQFHALSPRANITWLALSFKILAWTPTILICFYDFPQSFQTNTRIVPNLFRAMTIIAH